MENQKLLKRLIKISIILISIISCKEVVVEEINGFIDNISSKYDDIKIILTGGNAKFLSKTLKITIFANQNFILDGLNSILNLNKE